MNTVYSDVVFTNSQPDQPTAIKLNLLRDDLSAAISSIGGYYTDTWRWTTNTANAAVSGNVGINAASWSAATFLNISETDAAGTDKTIQMDKVNAVGNAILVKDAANASNYAEYTITGPGVDMGTWRQYPVSTTKFSGVPPKNGANTTLTVYVQGATGGSGTGTGDMTKAIYDIDNNGKVDTCDSLPWGSLTGKPTTIGDMLKSVYDTNGDGISDHAAQADSVPWTGVTGRPSVFPPDSTAMLKSVYDTNGDGISDHAALADTAPWTGITGKPTSFTPSAHASTHQSGGGDAIPIDTLGVPTDITTLNASPTAHGLLPKLANTATKFLRDDGTWQAIGGGGDMLKSTYDTNLDGIVDKAAVLSTAGAIHQFWKNGNIWGQPDWSDLTGIPAGNLVQPGTWTNLSLGTGWTAPTQAQYRLEVNGGVSTVHFRGMIQAAYSALGTTAFTAPAGAQPSMTRSCVLGGAQNTGTPSDVASYVASVSSAGVCTIFFLGAGPFVWADPSQTQQVYLDGLFYSL